MGDIEKANENTSASVDQSLWGRLSNEFETLCWVTPWNPGTYNDYPWFTQGDLTSLVVLFSDNIITIVTMMIALHSLPGIVYEDDENFEEYKREWEKVTNEKVIPGLAFALLLGNIWYAWMATKLAEKERRSDVCAQPFGVNTPAAFVFIFNVCLPVMFAERGKGSSPVEMADNVWKTACSANFLGGLIEVFGCIVASPIRNNMAMASIMGPIAGIGLLWLGFSPLMDLFREPIIGMCAFCFAWAGFFGKVDYFSGRLPFAIVVIVISTVFVWSDAGRWVGFTQADKKDEFQAAQEYLWKNALSLRGLEGLGNVGDYISTVFPIALNNFIGTMMVVESAHLAGDNFPLAESMISDGLTTICASVFGSVLPTTVYIGHPFYKSTGATRGYAVVNGAILFILCSAGLMPLVQAMISVTGAHMILVCVGFLIVSQSVELTVTRHYPALFISLMPIIADYTKTTFASLAKEMPGLMNLGLGGGILISMLFTQICCDLIDRRFLSGAFYAAICVVFSFFGIIHPNNNIYWNGDLTRGDNTIEPGKATIASFRKIYDANGQETDNEGDLFDGDGMATKFFCEGWRFCIGYTCVIAYCLIHYLLQKYEYVEAPDWSTSYCTESLEDDLKGKIEQRRRSSMLLRTDEHFPRSTKGDGGVEMQSKRTAESSTQ